ncbi:MAG TPA: wax ester/triacylglycerol synthase family O-acyltransferase, partial [Burkholderiaceae bacterium]|nr:wax ester/triacylglycerol synthase family O-acyltransferase [Burkholderiaceae bacterium]
MKQLSGLDASFLHLETPEMPMHVGGLNLFDLPPGHRGDFYDEVKAHILSRMHLAGIFTKKLALMPFDLSNPVWVDDDDVDIDYHIRRITLPKPGTMAQLETYVGRLHSSLLDRSRPLWEFYVFDGLQSGQAAFYSKIHHAALDGKGGEALAQAMLDVTPVPRAVKKAEAHAKGSYLPSVTDMVGAAFRNNLAQYWKMIKFLPATVKAIGAVVVPAKGADGKRHIGFPNNFKLGPKTPLNVAITNQRAFATLKVSLAEAREVAKAFDGSLNDAVMGICSGALRSYLQSKHALPKKTLVVALPVSLREEGNTELNNQVSMMLVNLATDIADPKKRMREFVQSSNAMKVTLKNVKSVIPTDFPGLGAPWLMS